MPQSENINTVSITLPRRRETDSLARLATTAVACQAGLNLDQADDLNTAVEEIVRALAAEDTASGVFTILYRVFPDRLEIVSGSFSGPVLDGASEASRYRRFVLEKTTDLIDEQQLPDGRFNVLMTKRV